MTQSLPDLHIELCDILGAWKAYEASVVIPIVRINNLISYETEREVSGRYEVREALASLQEKMAYAGDTKTARRIQSFVTFLDYNDSLTRRPPLHEYFAAMTGLRLEVFDEDQIIEIKTPLLEALDKLGIPLDNVHEALLAREPELSESDYLLNLRQGVAEDMGAFKMQSGLAADVIYEVGLYEDEKSQVAECVVEGRTFKALFNGNIYGLRPDATREYGHHELIGHALQIATVRDLVENEKLPPSDGFHLTIGPEIVQQEAIAESITSAFPPKTDTEAAWRLFGTYRRMVGHNAMVIFATQGREKAAAYYAAAAPFIPEDRREKLMARAAKHNAASYYSLSYGPAKFALDGVARKLGKEGFARFLGKVMSGWLDVEGLNKAIVEAGAGRYALPAANVTA